MLRRSALFLVAAVCLAEESRIGQLSWLAGCWSTAPGAVTIEEHWSKPAGGGMLGYSRTLKGGRTIFSEFIRLDAEADQVIYTPRIGTRHSPVPFRLIKLSGMQAVFENPAHDFPQRILYRREGDLLHARIEGTDKGRERGEDFPYKRVPCDFR